MRKILYVDMDNVHVDFASGIARTNANTIRTFEGRLDDVPGIFSLMAPVEGAIEGFAKLTQHFDTYVLSTAPWQVVTTQAISQR